jgi:hypothetical protein
MILQLFPDSDSQIFDRAKLVPHERHFYIDVPVVKHIYHPFLYDGAQFLGIKNKTCFGIGHTFDRNVQFEVMAMPVRVGTPSEYGLVLFSRPIGVVKFVSGIEMLLARYIYHSCPENLRKGKGFAPKYRAE